MKIPVSCIDSDKVDANNILNIIFNNTDIGFYKIGIKNEILSLLYARNQIFECKKQLFRSKDVPNSKISLKTVSIQN